MRIALLSWESLQSIAVGGVGVHVSQLASALTAKGHHVHVFTRRAQTQPCHECIEGVHYHRCTYQGHSDFIEDVNNMCRAFVDRVFEVEDLVGRFDVVHAHDWLAANAMIWIKQGRSHPCVLTIHSTEFGRCGNAFCNGRSERVRCQERAGTYWADRVIAVSKATQDEIHWMYEVPASKTCVVYNGVDPYPFDRVTDPGLDKRRYGLGPLDPTILFCGRLVWQKGPDLLVEAIGPVLRQHSAAKVLFVGDGEMRGSLEARVRQLGVAHAVRFLGFRRGDELVSLFKLADVVCIPSRNEPFGIVVIEAWSASKPVVVTQNGGPNEFVWHEVNGLKIHPSPDSVAWGLGRMFSDFDRARWMGSNGRKAVEERFTWDIAADKTLDVYRCVCPSPQVSIPIPARPAQAVMDKPRPKKSRVVKTARVPPLRPGLVEAIGGYSDLESSVFVQASLCFKTQPSAPEGVADAMAVCGASLACSGLEPIRHDHSLTVRGDMERVVAALDRCRGRMEQLNGADAVRSGKEDGTAGRIQTQRVADRVLVGR